MGAIFLLIGVAGAEVESDSVVALTGEEREVAVVAGIDEAEGGVSTSRSWDERSAR